MFISVGLHGFSHTVHTIRAQELHVLYTYFAASLGIVHALHAPTHKKRLVTSPTY